MQIKLSKNRKFEKDISSFENTENLLCSNLKIVKNQIEFERGITCKVIGPSIRK